VVKSRRKYNKLYYTVKWAGDKITEEPWYNLLPGSDVHVANFHKKYLNMLGPPTEYKPKLMHLMTGGLDSAMAHDPLLVAEPNSVHDALVVGEPTSRRLTNLEASHSDGVLTSDASAALVALHNYDDDVAVQARDAWLLDVTGAPYWEGGSNVTK